jgi:O-antigen ligase
VGGALAAVVTMLMVRELRRWALPVLGVSAILMACLVAFVPGMSSKVHERITSTSAHRSGWDRKNLNSAAVRMAEAHPLFGVGWDEFTERAEPYLRTAPGYPMTGGINGTGTVQVVHNAFLSNAAELGLIGTFLWCAALAGVFFGAVFQRHPPELRPWRIALLAMAIMWVVVSNLIPLSKPFPTLLLFLWAGLAYEPGVALAPVPARRKLVSSTATRPAIS